MDPRPGGRQLRHPSAAAIQALTDGQASSADHLRLRRHILACGSCREAERRTASMAAAVEALPQAQAPAGLVDQVMRRIRRLPRPERLRPALRLVAPLAVLAAGALILMRLPGLSLGGGLGRLLRLDSLPSPDGLELAALALQAAGSLGRSLIEIAPPAGWAGEVPALAVAVPAVAALLLAAAAGLAVAAGALLAGHRAALCRPRRTLPGEAPGRPLDLT